MFTESKLPVGSSAKISWHGLIKRRAKATLCCSPPSYYELGKIKITINDLISYCEAVGCDYIEVLKKANGEWA